MEAGQNNPKAAERLIKPGKEKDRIAAVFIGFKL